MCSKAPHGTTPTLTSGIKISSQTATYINSRHYSLSWLILRRPRRVKTRSHGITRSDKAPQGRTRSHKASQGLTRSHKVSKDLTRPHKVSQGLTRSHKASQGLTRSHKVSQGLTRAHMWYIFSIKASRDHCHLSGKGSSASILELRRLMKKI